MGCVLYYMSALEPPFSGENLISLGYNIVNRMPKSIPSIYSEELNKFIMTLLEKDPEKRKPLSQVITLIPIGKKQGKSEIKNENNNLINEIPAKEKNELQTKEKNQSNFFAGKKELTRKNIIEKKEENNIEDKKKETNEFEFPIKNNILIAEIIPKEHANLESVRVNSPIILKKDGFLKDEKKDAQSFDKIKTENKQEILSKEEIKQETICKPSEMNENLILENQIEQNEKKATNNSNSSNLQKFKIRPFSANVAPSKPKEDKKGECILIFIIVINIIFFKLYQVSKISEENIKKNTNKIDNYISHHQNNINNFRPKSAIVNKHNNFKNVTPILSSRLVNNFVNNNAEPIIKKEVDEKSTVLISDVKKSTYIFTFSILGPKKAKNHSKSK